MWRAYRGVKSEGKHRFPPGTGWNASSRTLGRCRGRLSYACQHSNDLWVFGSSNWYFFYLLPTGDICYWLSLLITVSHDCSLHFSLSSSHMAFVMRPASCLSEMNSYTDTSKYSFINLFTIYPVISPGLLGFSAKVQN